MKNILLTDDAEYKAANDNQRTLQERRHELVKKIDEVRQEKRQRVPLGADLVVGAEAPPVRTIPDDQAITLQSELRKIDSAIALQQGVLDKMKDSAGRRLCKQIAPDYRQRLAALADALMKLGEATDGVTEFHDFYTNRVPLTTPIMRLCFDSTKFSGRNSQSAVNLLLAKVNQCIAAMDAAMPPAPAETDPAAMSSRRPARR